MDAVASPELARSMKAASFDCAPADLFVDTLRDARKGDGAAFAVLFHGLGPQLCGFVATQGVADPELLTNEVFVRTFLDPRRLDGPRDRFTGRLFALARELVKAERETAAAAPGGEVPALEVGDEPLDAWLAERSADGIDLALLHLTPTQREILMLAVLGRLSVAEIAIAMNQRPAHVRGVWRAIETILARHLAGTKSKIVTGQPSAT